MNHQNSPFNTVIITHMINTLALIAVIVIGISSISGPEGDHFVPFAIVIITLSVAVYFFVYMVIQSTSHLQKLSLHQEEIIANLNSLAKNNEKLTEIIDQISIKIEENSK
jgi:hypothetical protein